MRIAIIVSDPASGILFHSARLAIRIKAAGVDVHALAGTTRAQSPRLVDELREHSIPLHLCDDLNRSGSRALLGANRAIRTALRQIDPDVVHTFGAVSSYQCSSPKSRYKTISMIGAAAYSWLHVELASRLASLLLRCSSDLTCLLCTAEYQRFRRAGLAGDHMRIIPMPLDCAELLAMSASINPVDTRREYGIPIGEPLLGYFANFKPGKNHAFLLKALARVRCKPWQLVCAGEGSTVEATKQCARTLGLESRVTMLPRLPISSVTKLIRACDVVLHASNAETFGFSMLEPLLFGKRLIATRVGVAWDLEKDGVATVVSVRDETEFAGAVARAVLEPPLASYQARRLTEYVRAHFDVPVVVAKLLDAYQHLCANE